MTRHFSTIKYKDRYQVICDNYNNRYAVFCRHDGFSQQVSKWYILKQCAINKFNIITGEQL